VHEINREFFFSPSFMLCFSFFCNSCYGIRALLKEFFMSSSSFTIDDSSPYHLHHGNSPGTVLVSQLLDGDNYHTWSRSMVMALTAKNKLSFLNDSLSKPSD
jgi:hypothetical protein